VTLLDRFDMSGKSVVITGGGGGLGRAIALGAASAGADIVVVGRTQSSLDETCAGVEELGRRATGVVLDVSSPETVESVFAQLAASGPLDILINNAGLAVQAPIWMLEAADWQSTFDTNLSGAYYCTRAFVAPQAPAGRVVVNISSFAAAVGISGLAAYCASKGGLEALTRSMAIELAPRGIRVNALASGYATTDMPSTVISDPRLLDKVVKRIPLRRFAHPSEVASGVLFLASAASSYMTGAVLTMDGGLTAQ
jgi:NAD(P)-dependent dehydrogenase (short-subunit alcohol dehydrogenase family)